MLEANTGLANTLLVIETSKRDPVSVSWSRVVWGPKMEAEGKFLTVITSHLLDQELERKGPSN